MRQVFLFLLFLNVGFFAAQAYYPELLDFGGPAARPPAAGTAPSLTLLREVSGTAKATEEAAPPREEAEPPAAADEEGREGEEPKPRGVPALPLIPEPIPTPPPEAATPPAGSEPETGGERAPAESAAAAESVTVQLPPPTGCWALGPFADADAAKRAATHLATLNVTARVRSGRQQEWVGHWIYVPPLPSRTEARKLAQEMGERGLKDYFVIGTQDYENAISLGVYKDPQAARRRLKRLRDMGYDAQMQDYFQGRTRYWLDYGEGGVGGLPPEVLEEFRRNAPDLEEAPRPCP